MPQRKAGEAYLALPVSQRRDHIRGNPSGAVTLVEYGDFQCPYCGKAYPIVEKLLKEMGDDIRFVFRNFPLTQIHPDAQLAAEAAESAAAQGKFWEMHDALYENQAALDRQSLIGYAADLGLNLPQFQLELTEHTHLPRVKEDFSSGIRSGVNGTPSFFINERRHDGEWDLRSLMAAIEEEMEQEQESEAR